jgi:hypothetical protein
MVVHHAPAFRLRIASLAVLVALAVTIVSGKTAATTITVPTDAPSIREGLALTAPGDTVLVLAGTYGERSIRIDHPVTILGQAGSGSVTIRGDGPVIPGDTTSIFICHANRIRIADLTCELGSD